MRSIFLSASVPIKERHTKYIDTVDLTAVRDAVLALVNVCLRNELKIVWGGHPAITPLVYQAIKQILIQDDSLDYYKIEKSLIQKYVWLFQSLQYKEAFPKDSNFFENITFTDVCEDNSSSLLLMRERMIESEDFYAGVFIGGMEGVETEYNLFRKKHPNALLLPMASTGAASRIIYDRYKSECNFPAELNTNYAFNTLFYKYLVLNTRDNL